MPTPRPSAAFPSMPVSIRPPSGQRTLPSDPLAFVRALLGPNATPEMIAKVMAAGQPDQDPAPQPAAPDWTQGVANSLHPLGLPAKGIAGAGLMAAGLAFPPAGLAGAALSGGLGGAGMGMLQDQDATGIGKSALGGAVGGAMMSKALPAVAGYLGNKLPGVASRLSNSFAADRAMAGMGGDLSMAPSQSVSSQSSASATRPFQPTLPPLRPSPMMPGPASENPPWMPDRWGNAAEFPSQNVDLRTGRTTGFTGQIPSEPVVEPTIPPRTYPRPPLPGNNHDIQSRTPGGGWRGYATPQNVPASDAMKSAWAADASPTADSAAYLSGTSNTWPSLTQSGAAQGLASPAGIGGTQRIRPPVPFADGGATQQMSDEEIRAFLKALAGV